jgi:leucyl aminopeptidase (aminopeptidase T)
MKQIETIRGARTIVETCAGVKAGENVLIITDTNMVEIAEVLAMAVKERDAEPILAIMIPRKGHSEEPPACLAEAMKKADVVLTPVSTSITHTKAMKEAAAAGSRAIVMTAFTEDLDREELRRISGNRSPFVWRWPGVSRRQNRSS